MAEASQLGLDYRQAEQAVRLYDDDGDGPASSSAESKLRKLQPGEVKAAVEGHKYWTSTRLLDHQVGVLRPTFSAHHPLGLHTLALDDLLHHPELSLCALKGKQEAAGHANCRASQGRQAAEGG